MKKQVIPEEKSNNCLVVSIPIVEMKLLTGYLHSFTTEHCKVNTRWSQALQYAPEDVLVALYRTYVDQLNEIKKMIANAKAGRSNITRSMIERVVHSSGRSITSKSEEAEKWFRIAKEFEHKPIYHRRHKQDIPHHVWQKEEIGEPNGV